MIDPHYVILGAVISFAGGLSYLAGTLRGSVQPNRVSWFIWSLAPLVAFAAELKQGVGLRSLTTFMVGFIPLLVLTASFITENSQWKLTTFDLCCGGLSLAGLGLWYVTGAGNVAIAFSILADALAAVPTMVKAYVEPESENFAAFLAFAISGLITLATVRVWDFETYGFPLNVTVLSLILAALIKFRPVRLAS